MVGAEGIEPSTYAGYGFYRAARTIATSLPKIGCAGRGIAPAVLQLMKLLLVYSSPPRVKN